MKFYDKNSKKIQTKPYHGIRTTLLEYSQE